MHSVLLQQHSQCLSHGFRASLQQKLNITFKMCRFSWKAYRYDTFKEVKQGEKLEFQRDFYFIYSLAFSTSRGEYQKLPEVKLHQILMGVEHSNHGIALKTSARESQLHTVALPCHANSG